MLSAGIGQIEQRRQPGDDPWAHHARSTLPRGTCSLAFAGESRIAEIARELALTQPELSQIIGLTPVLLERWGLGALLPEAAVVARYEQLIRIHFRLYGVVPPHDVPSWLRTEQDALGDRSPVAAMCAGDLHQVESALERLDVD